MSEKQKAKTGPKEDRLKIDEGNWEDAVKKALEKPSPQKGWPKHKPGPEGDNAQIDPEK